MSDIEKSILTTLTYYDILDIPLTLLEIYRYSVLPRITFVTKVARGKTDENTNNTIFSDIQTTLDQSAALKEKIDNLFGFYFLKSREIIVLERIKKDLLLDAKWKKLSKIAKFLKFLPFLELAFVSGSMAVGNIKPSSDFDLILSFKQGQIWTGRFLAAGLFEILRSRRKGHIHKPEESRDKICLYHFLTEASYSHCPRNVYWANIYKRLICVFCRQPENLRNFIDANYWINEYFFASETESFRCNSPDFPYRGLNILPQRPIRTIILEKILSGKIGDVLEKILKTYQSRRIRKFLKEASPQGRIVFNDAELEFVPLVTKETKILKEFETRRIF